MGGKYQVCVLVDKNKSYFLYMNFNESNEVQPPQLDKYLS